MKGVLQKLSSTNQTGEHYANPRSSFEAATRALQNDRDGPIELSGKEGDSSSSRLGPIAKLARDLIPG